MFKRLLIKFLKNLWKNEKHPAGDWKLPQQPACLVLLCNGGIGDILMCTPAMRAIKQTFPQCRVIAFVNHKKEAILRNNPHIDRLFSVKRSLFNYARIHSILKAERPDAAILFHGNDPFIYALFHKACSGLLIGFKTNNPLTFLLNDAIPFDNDLHVIDNNLELVRLIGAHTGNRRMALESDLDSKAKAEVFVKFSASRSTIIGFQLGANFRGKCWDLENFIQLGRRLVKTWNAELVIVGGPADRIQVKAFCREFGEKAHPLINDLGMATSVMSRFEVFITPDTGPMHMAFALGCPTVALFGPTNPKHFGPLTEADRHIVIHKAVLDRPAIKIHNDPEDRMGKISVDEVYQAVIQLLERSR